MQAWRFLMPGALGFTLKNFLHGGIDRLTGKPSRPLRTIDYVAANARAGDPRDVLRSLDRFATEVRWLMSVGPEKDAVIREVAPRLPENPRVLELGAYCGYSAILIADTLGPGATLTSLEINPDMVTATRANVGVAGLSDRVTVIEGSSSDSIGELEGTFDLIFLDHWKDLYLPDLKLMESRGLLKSGTVVVADNVGEIFGAEKYLDYVRNSGSYHSENRPATIEYTNLPDAVEISTHL
jgi:catechol O-methyltransferase